MDCLKLALAGWARHRLINNVTSAVEWPIPYSTKFKVISAIDRHGCRSFRDRCNQDAYRRLHNLIALGSWLVEHTVRVGVVFAATIGCDRGFRDRRDDRSLGRRHHGVTVALGRVVNAARVVVRVTLDCDGRRLRGKAGDVGTYRQPSRAGGCHTGVVAAPSPGRTAAVPSAVSAGRSVITGIIVCKILALCWAFWP